MKEEERVCQLGSEGGTGSTLVNPVTNCDHGFAAAMGVYWMGGQEDKELGCPEKLAGAVSIVHEAAQ